MVAVPKAVAAAVAVKVVAAEKVAVRVAAVAVRATVAVGQVQPAGLRVVAAAMRLPSSRV